MRIRENCCHSSLIMITVTRWMAPLYFPKLIHTNMIFRVKNEITLIFAEKMV